MEEDPINHRAGTSGEGYDGAAGASGATGDQTPKLYAFLHTMREWVANWQLPCGGKLVRHFLDKANKVIDNPTSQRRIILVVVCIALLLDNMLYMVIVPIIPTYLREIHAFKTEEKYVTALVPVNFTTPELKYISEGMVTELPPKPIEPNNSLTRSIKLYAEVYSKNEDVNIGVLFACKAMFQLLINPFTGTLMDRIGYDIPMMIGLTIIFFSTTMFAFGRSYGALFFARSLQGVGSAFADTSGLAMIADRYTDDADRSAALGVALAFISFGSLVAPPFGGSLYEFAGKEIPFILLALIALFDGCLMLFSMKPVRRERKELKKEHKLPKGTPIYKLIIDPYIAACAGCLVMANVSLAFIEPTIAIWMKDTMNAPEWQIGIIWLPAFIPHVLGVFVTVKLAERYPNKQWLMAAIGLAMEGVSCMIIPFCKTFGVLIIPLSILCFGIALVDTAILPIMGHLVDVRHVSVYGSVYAIADISYCIAYAFGPIVAGQTVKGIGFLALNAGIFVSNIVYAPVLIILRNVYDYHRFVPGEDNGLGNGTDDAINAKSYRSYTEDSEEHDAKIDLEAIVTHNTVRRYETSESEEDDEPDETTSLNQADPNNAGGLAGDQKPKPLSNIDSKPVPKPRRLSIDQLEFTERKPTVGYSDASETESEY